MCNSIPHLAVVYCLGLQVLLVLGYSLLVVCKQPELWRVRTPHMVAYSPHTNTVVLETVATVASNTVLLT